MNAFRKRPVASVISVVILVTQFYFLQMKPLTSMLEFVAVMIRVIVGSWPVLLYWIVVIFMDWQRRRKGIPNPNKLPPSH